MASARFATDGAREQRPLLKWAAGVSAAALAVGMLVVAGLGADSALAGPQAPGVTASPSQTLILGEDAGVNVVIENQTSSPTYNLSVALLMPDTVELVEPTPFGPFVSFAANEEVPGNPVAANGETCATAGLLPLNPGSPSGNCVVPEGKQYLVFENFSDLPVGGVYSETVNIRPKVNDDTDGFNVGDLVDVLVSAYTSEQERYIPMFPGSTTKGGSQAESATSGRGSDLSEAEVRALRITKSEPSPESELLRGVHEQTTVYTLTVDHTGEGDLQNAKIVDFLPAGLEYLGSCSLTDNTTAANGIDDAEEEWSGTSDSSGPVNTSPVAQCAEESSIDTIRATAEFIADYPDLGLQLNAIYTMVTWDLGTWAAAAGSPQDFPEHAGQAAQTVIQYRAGVPLFENELFAGTAPLPESLEQGANLDNNTGASTRHGSSVTEDGSHDAISYRNIALASGEWKGVESSDDDDYTIDAVDTRVVKRVRVGQSSDWGSQASFEQGAIADYRLRLDTSEYVAAQQGENPNRFTDDLDNGLCPVFPTNIRDFLTPGVGDGSSEDGFDQDGQPNLLLVNPNETADRDYVSAQEFNDALNDAGLSECRWADAAFTDDALFEGATLSSIAFDPVSGRFFQSFQLGAAALDGPNLTHDVIYSVHQNRSYLDTGNTNGSTTSGDTVSNRVEIDFTTIARDGVNGLENSEGVSAGDQYWAWDNSDAQLEADFSDMSKWVLKNQAGSGGLAPADLLAADYPTSAPPVDPADPASLWTKNEERPFAVGDEVWFRIHYEPASGADVRNPVLTDFLPDGVAFDKDLLDDENQWQDSPNYRVYASNGGSPIQLTPSSPVSIGTCVYDGTAGHDANAAYAEFVDELSIDGRRLTWELGSDACFPTGDPSASQDRFWPKNLYLDIYLRVTVTDADAFGNEDLRQNLAKYQQENVEGQVFFLRDAAEVTAATTPKLVKGIRDIDDEPGAPFYPDGNPFNSDVDHQRVVQKNQVTFRVDVTAPVRGVDPETGALAPNTDSSGYVVWDALPAGITKADIEGYDDVLDDGTFSSATVKLAGRTWVEADPDTDPPTPAGWMYSGETTVDPGDFTAVVCDFGDPCYPASGAVRDDIWNAERSLVMWRLDAAVPASNAETELEDETTVVPRTERGFSLQYTVVVPDGSTDSAEALVTQSYENTASIVSYQPVKNTTPGGSSASTVFITGDDALSTTGADPDESDQFDASDTGTFDDSDVYLPDLDFSKRLVSTEVGSTTPNGNDTVGLTQIDGTRNNQSQIVQGEYATFEYALTIPAHTSVSGAVLSDGGSLARSSGGPVRYEFVSAEFFGPGNTGATADTCGAGELADFTCQPTVGSGASATHGVLTFPTAEPYQNATSQPQTFRVRVAVWMKDRDNNDANSSVTQIANNIGLTNTATASYDNPAFGEPGESERLTQTGSATATFVEPNPTLTKTVTNPADGEIDINGEAEYLLTASNQNGRPALYDSVVVDCVPADMEIVASSVVASAGTSYTLPAAPAGLCSVSGNVITQGSGTGQLIVWTIGQINGTGTTGAPTLSYKAKAQNDVGSGLQLRNVARLDGYTLPDPLTIGGSDRATDARRGFYTRTDDATVRMVDARLQKSVATPNGQGSAPIGETVRYTLDIDLPPYANFYDVRLTDSLPVGLEYAGGYDVEFTGWDEGAVPLAEPSLPEPSASGAPATGQTLTWAIAPDDFGLHTVPRTIRVSFDALITDGVNAAAPLNSATFSWNQVNGQESTRTPSTDTAGVTILNPQLGIVKDVRFNDSQGTSGWGQTATGNPDRTLEYRIIVRNDGNTDAFHNVVIDTLPAGVVNPRAFTIGGAAITAPSTAVWNSGDRTITWTLPNAIANGTPVTLGYTADFAPSANLTSNTNGQGGLLVNTAKVDHYESFPRDPADPDTATGREYDPANVQDTAEARAQFPRVTLTKAAADTSHTAYVGEPFEWVLTATNANQGAAQKVVLSDTLPANWTFTEVKSITVAGASVAASDPSGTPDGPLVWTFGADAAAGGLPAAILPPGQSIVIRYTATPKNPEALTTPGVGSSNPHINTLSAVTTDRTNATSNQTRSHTGPNASDNAFLREADLELVKETLGGVTATVPTSHPLSGVAQGSWVIGQSVEAGVYTQPQWRITVTNHGPDDGYGPFTVTDTLSDTPGVTTGTWTAQYFAPGASTGTPITDVTVTPTGLVVGTNGTSLKADGTDRIVLTANVTIDASTVPDSVASNTASVEGRTYEDPANKGTDADHPNEDSAEKTVTESADLQVVKTVGTSVNAGETINWSIQPINNGPSVSRNSASDPITITDTVPAGVSAVADPSNAMWDASVPGGFPASADSTITFTLNSSYDSLAVGGAGVHAPIALSGTVDAGWTPTSGPENDGSIVNTAVIIPDLTPDPKAPNNTDDAGVTPSFDTALDITKVRVVWDDDADAWVPAASLDPVPSVESGDPVSYLVTVSNNGNAVARGVKVVDETPTYLSNPNHDSVDENGALDASVTWLHTSGGTNSVPVTNAHWDTYALQGTLPVDESRSFVVTYDTSPTSPANVVNWVEASSDDNSNHPRDDEGFDSERVTDLSIAKTHTAPAADVAVKAGETVDYRLVVTNEGPSDAVGPIDVTDTLPAQFSYVAGSATVDGVSAAPNVSGQVLSWEVLSDTGTLPIAAGSNTIVIEFQARVSAEHPEAEGVLNWATVDGQDDSNPGNNTRSDEIDVVTEATMTIDKVVTSPAAAPWYAGTDVTYTLTVTNNGPSVAPAHVVDTLPAGLGMVSMSGDDWDCAVTPGALTGVCDYDGLHPVGAGEATTITVVAHIASGLPNATQTNPFVNEAVLTWTDGRSYADPADDPRHDDDDASITVTTQADLGLVKTAVDPSDNTTEVSSAVAGEQARYRIDVTNYGPSDAAPDLVVTDTLPLGVSYVAPAGTTAANWDVQASAYDPLVAQTVTFTRIAGGTNIGLPMSGTDPTDAPAILFDVLLEPGLPVTAPPGVLALVNTATVASATPEPSTDPHPNTDDAPLDVTRSSDLAIVKTHPSDANGQVHVGDPLDFTIQVTNNGPSEASGITVTDTVPVGLEVTSAVGPVAGTAWTIDSISLVDPLDPLGGAIVVASYAPALGVTAPSNAADPLVISTVIHEDAHGTVPNHVEVTGNEPDPDPDDNEWNDPLDVNALVTLVVEKTAVGEFQVGKTGTYRITVENQGPHADPGPITVTDVLPKGLIYHSSPSLPSDATVAVNGKTVVWTLPNGLAVDETQTLTLVVNVQQAAYPEVTNTVLIDSPADKTPDSVLEDDETVPVKALDPLSITGGAAVGYLAMLAALLLLAGALIAARRRRGAHAGE